MGMHHMKYKVWYDVFSSHKLDSVALTNWMHLQLRNYIELKLIQVVIKAYQPAICPNILPICQVVGLHPTMTLKISMINNLQFRER